MQKFWLVLLPVFMLGCFNYTSVMKIDEDGSGTLRLKMELPLKENVTISIDEFKEGYDFDEGWETTAISIDTLDTTIVYRLEGKFDHPLAAPDIFGFDSLSFSKENTGRFHLYKEYDFLDDKENTEWIEKSAVKLSGYDLNAYTWSEKLILPGSVVESNADERKGDTLIWKRGTMDVLENGLITEAVWQVHR